MLHRQLVPDPREGHPGRPLTGPRLLALLHRPLPPQDALNIFTPRRRPPRESGSLPRPEPQVPPAAARSWAQPRAERMHVPGTEGLLGPCVPTAPQITASVRMLVASGTGGPRSGGLSDSFLTPPIGSGWSGSWLMEWFEDANKNPGLSVSPHATLGCLLTPLGPSVAAWLRTPRTVPAMSRGQRTRWVGRGRQCSFLLTPSRRRSVPRRPVSLADEAAACARPSRAWRRLAVHPDPGGREQSGCGTGRRTPSRAGSSGAGEGYALCWATSWLARHRGSWQKH